MLSLPFLLGACHVDLLALHFHVEFPKRSFFSCVLAHLSLFFQIELVSKLLTVDGVGLQCKQINGIGTIK